MPTRSVERGASPTRRRLLDAAEKLVRTAGLAGVTTKALAREARHSEAMLYQHFASKDELLVCLLRERLSALHSAVYAGPARDLDTQSTEQGCHDLAYRTIRYYEAAVPLLCPLLADPSLLAACGVDPPPPYGARHEPPPALVATLERWREAGRVRSDADLAVAATILAGACFQWVLQRQWGSAAGAVRDEEDFTANLARTLAHSLA
ncbi:TetR/AcrR family transcriptional regulator [Streptomyces sp. Je 1-79]|uniref:TetR/AcrR family transcriptional regulator n=1 Tax=Streptomyces sp. Je 1-79 TaxID=2943847 RepID=UPI0021A5B28B|nr:TetR/AcrR family transcriptional regulator [Streptomyces sp. Je 1-79]MCT4356446.1 TetR/AcrR family transcriptional regulator [Streptomyces sp. Je 1-79]